MWPPNKKWREIHGNPQTWIMPKNRIENAGVSFGLQIVKSFLDFKAVSISPQNVNLKTIRQEKSPAIPFRLLKAMDISDISWFGWVWKWGKHPTMRPPDTLVLFHISESNMATFKGWFSHQDLPSTFPRASFGIFSWILQLAVSNSRVGDVILVSFTCWMLDRSSNTSHLEILGTLEVGTRRESTGKPGFHPLFTHRSHDFVRKGPFSDLAGRLDRGTSLKLPFHGQN